MNICICINPRCRHINSDRELFCSQCQSELLIKNQFRATKLLSGGGVYCETYVVRDLEHKNEKILKLLKQSEAKLEELFRREYAALKVSDHPGIPKAEACFEFSVKNQAVPFLCLVMEKIEGMNLEDFLRQKGKPIDQTVAIKWMRQLLDIFQEIHSQNILHRDIKPANIMLRGNGQLALIDFGAAGIISNATGAGGTVVYTQDYVAPEQLMGNAVTQSDYFSMGRTFIHLLTGKSLPTLRDEFLRSQKPGEPQKFLWHTYANNITPEFSNLLNELMAEDVVNRPADTTTILNRLTEIEDGTIEENPFDWLRATEVGLPPTEIVRPVVTPTPPSTTPPSTTPPSTTSPSTNLSSWGGRGKKPIVFLVGTLSLLGSAFFGLNQYHAQSRLGSSETGQPSSPVVLSPVVQQCSTPRLQQQEGRNLFAVIEIGSSGVKGEVVQQLDSPDEAGNALVPREEEIEAQDVNPINPKAKGQTVQAVQSMFEEIQSRFNIPCEHISIYGSSGFASKSEQAHRVSLMQEIESKTGRAMDLITPDQEAIYVFNAVVPDHRRDQVMMIDIGSGNTKGAFDSGSQPDTISIPWGTKSLTAKIDTRPESQPFVAALNEFKGQYLPELRQEIRLKPVLGTKSRVYLSGGIVWALATLQRPCQSEQVVSKQDELPSNFVRVQVEDFTTFYNNVTRDQKVLFNPDLSQCTPEQRQQAEKDIAKIRNKVFTVDELTAGAELLQMLSSTLSFSDKDAMFFSRYAFEALPIGYLKEQLRGNLNANF